MSKEASVIRIENKTLWDRDAAPPAASIHTLLLPLWITLWRAARIVSRDTHGLLAELTRAMREAPLHGYLREHQVYYASLPTVRGVRPRFINDGVCMLGRSCEFVSYRSNTLLRVHRHALLDVGDHVSLGDGVHICANRRIVIGAHTKISEMASIYDADFHSPSPDRSARCEEVAIGRNVWIGARAMILPGGSIGDHAVVAAGSVVTRNVPARSVVGGAPATVLRTLKSADDWVRL